MIIRRNIFEPGTRPEKKFDSSTIKKWIDCSIGDSIDKIDLELGYDPQTELVTMKVGSTWQYLNLKSEVCTIYCEQCSKENDFTIKFHDAFSLGDNWYLHIHLADMHDHLITVSFLLESNSMIKIGHHPLQQMHYNRKYQKILGDNMELYVKSKIARLNNLHIGSIIYLRRIFEFLVNESDVNGVIVKDDRMSERIEKLVNDNQLDPLFMEPGFTILYGLLSKRAHLLTESECKDSFELLLQATDELIDVQLDKIEKEKKEIN